MTALNKPLVMDIDDTFLRTDMLFECLWGGLGSDPLATIRAVAKHWRDPATLKPILADIAQIDVELLPVNPDLKKLADENIAAGRRVILASASDKRLVDDLAASHGLDAAQLCLGLLCVGMSFPPGSGITAGGAGFFPARAA